MLLRSSAQLKLSKANKLLYLPLLVVASAIYQKGVIFIQYVLKGFFPFENSFPIACQLPNSWISELSKTSGCD